jgi:mevalonate pyrophosphate decarboxylase
MLLGLVWGGRQYAWSSAYVVAALAACGSSSTKPSKLSLSISEQGKAASFKAPKSAKGGLVDVTIKNSGKAPHGVQFVQYTGNHTVADALKQIASQSNKIPPWIKGNGASQRCLAATREARPSTCRRATTFSLTPPTWLGAPVLPRPRQ